MTDNTMTRRTKTNGQTIVYNTLHVHIKLKIEQHEPT